MCYVCVVCKCVSAQARTNGLPDLTCHQIPLTKAEIHAGLSFAVLLDHQVQGKTSDEILTALSGDTVFNLQLFI